MRPEQAPRQLLRHLLRAPRASTFFVETRGGVIGDGQLGMQRTRSLQEHVGSLGIVRIRDAAINRAYRGAGLMVIEADALGALGWNDIEDVLRDRWIDAPFNSHGTPPA